MFGYLFTLFSAYFVPILFPYLRYKLARYHRSSYKLSKYVCMYVRMYVLCKYVLCMHACMYVCMYAASKMHCRPNDTPPVNRKTLLSNPPPCLI
jgi:hypothetical protein